MTDANDNSPRPDIWPAFIVFAGVAVLMGFTIRDYGVTTDEPTYIRNNRHLRQWFADFADVGIAENLTESRLKTGWRYARPESRNLPMVSVVSTFGAATIGRFDSFPAAYRWGNVLVFAAACAVGFHWVRRRLSTPAACVALLALLGNPRLFAHANLVAIDTLVGCFWLLASWALVNSRGNWRAAFAFAVLAGLGATTKPTFWFAVPVWIVWGLSHRPRELWRSAVCLLMVAPLTACLFLPMWWSDPVGGFVDYLELLTGGSGGWEIGTYYLGDLYQTAATGPVPWHAVVVMPTVTTPLWILALSVIGGVLAVTRFRDPSRDDGLWLLCASALPFVCMLPSTPNHDGLRLYRATFFFIPLLAGGGFDWLRQRSFWQMLTNRGRRNWPDGVMIAGLSIFAVWQSAQMHPGQLSFYNLAAGGLRGAAEPRSMPATLPERNRPRHEIAYWWSAMNNEAFRDMQSQIPQDGKLWVFPHHDGLDMLAAHDVLRSDIRIVQPSDQPQFLLLYGRLGSLADPRAAPLATLFLHRKPAWERRIAGVRVAALYRYE